MARYIGNATAESLKIPCSGLTTGSILTPSRNSATTGEWGKVQSRHWDTDSPFGTTLFANGDFGHTIADLSLQPDGYTVADGTFGTDIQVESGRAKSGLYVVEFPGSDGHLFTPYFPVEADELYYAGFTIKSDNTGSNTEAYAYWYDADKVVISSTVIHDATVAVANTWEVKDAYVTAPSTAKFSRIYFGKGNATGTMEVDRVWCERGRVAFKARRTTDQASIGTSNVKLQLNSEASPGFDFGAKYDPTTNYRWTPGAPGIYQLSFSGFFTGISQDAQLVVFIGVNGSAGPAGYSYSYSPVASGSMGVTITSPLIRQTNTTDYYEVYARVSSGTTTLAGASLEAVFTGERVR